MDARTAILRAVKWASKDKAPTRGMQGVLLLPAVVEPGVPRQLVPHPDKKLAKAGELVPLPHFPPVVMATDGTSGIVIILDPLEVVPHVCVDAGAVEKALKGLKKDVAFWWEPRHKGSVLLQTELGTKFLLQTYDPLAHPGYPQLPSYLSPVPGFAHVRRLEHIAMKDVTRPALCCLHFADSYVEATDETRNGRVPVACGPPHGALVPKTLFRQWPKSDGYDVGVAFEHDLVFLHVGGELRWAETLEATGFPDLAPILPETHLGHRTDVDVATLKQAVKFATVYSPKDWVELRFHAGVLAITGLTEDGEVGFSHTVDAPGATDLVKVTVRGRLLWESLHVLSAGTVTLCYSTAEQPLRIEADGYVEALHPLLHVG